MKKKPAQPTHNHSLKKVVLFCVTVICLIIVSLLVRFIGVVKSSSFDNKNRFNFAITKDGRDAIAVSFNPTNKSIVEVFVKGDRKEKSLGRILGIPFDGIAELPTDSELSQNTASMLINILIQKDIKKSVTEVDLLQMYLFTKSISLNDYSKVTITLPTDANTLDKTISQLFSDQVLLDEGKSIEIVNGTGEDGLGKRLERVIENNGGNVVAISTTHTVEDTSHIYYYEDTSYTLRKIQKLLRYKTTKMTDREIADIKIVIGKDGMRETVF